MVQNKTTGDYHIYVENKSNESRTVVIQFSSLLGYTASSSLPVIKTVGRGTRLTVVKLTPQENALTRSIRYSVKQYRGCTRIKPDLDVKYLFPVAKGKETTVWKLKTVDSFINGANTPSTHNGYSYSMTKGDTIFAMRKGTVVSVEAGISTDFSDSDSQLTYTSEKNTIIVEHDDCSFGHYKIFEAGSAFIKPGDQIIPGSPLALAGGHEYTTGTQVRFTVYGFDNIKAAKEDTQKNAVIYFPLQLVGSNGPLKSGGTYKNDYTDEIIFMEFSKRERKKWAKGH